MFTAVIPMFIVMNQADTLHEMRKHEVELLDEAHSREDISFYPYPLTNDSDKLNISVVNKCGATVKIIRIWINNENYTLDENIQSMQTRVLGNFTVALKNQTSYTIKLITEKGTVFSSKAGTLYYLEGSWYTPSLGICVHIINLKGKYWVNITREGELVGTYKSQGMDFEDLIMTFMVDYPGFYNATIKKHIDGDDWEDLPGTPIINIIEIKWPGPNPIVYVLADGK